MPPIDYSKNNYCSVCEKVRPKPARYCPVCFRRVRTTPKNTKWKKVDELVMRCKK